MFARAKSIFNNTTSLVYYTASAVYEAGAASVSLVSTAAYATAATAYTVKGIAKAAYYSAKHLPTVGAAVAQYPSAIVDYYVTTGEAAAWTEADLAYAKATNHAKVDFNETVATYCDEIAGIQDPLIANSKATAAHASKFLSSTATASGHALELGYHACDLGGKVLNVSGKVLKKAGDIVLGEKESAEKQDSNKESVSQANNVFGLFSKPKVVQSEDQEKIPQADLDRSPSYQAA